MGVLVGKSRHRKSSAKGRASVATTWWLDWSALPDQLIWARLQVGADSTAVVLDMDGVYHQFSDLKAAIDWLHQDEYSQLIHMVESGEVDATVSPPTAANDQELVPLMLVQRGRAGSHGFGTPVSDKKSPH
jgi:hypothetical protein